MTAVYVVLPAGVDDPQRPSGGNTFDRRICDGLSGLGWDVLELAIEGPWPGPDGSARGRVAHALGSVPDDDLVLLDGLVASAVPDVLAAHAGRLRLVVLVHLPLGVQTAAARIDEHCALRAARVIVVPSRWCRDWLIAAYDLPATRVLIVSPGADPASLTVPSSGGGRLLSVAAVSWVKGQDVLVDALAQLADLDWSCTIVGSTCVEPNFARRVRLAIESAGLGSRARLLGPQIAADLEAAYGTADLLVSTSRTETYGIVVTEALARGVPVLAPAVGGLPEAIGRTPEGIRAGLLYSAPEPGELGAALRCWLTDAGLRSALRAAAGRRRAGLAPWSQAVASVAAVLREVAA